MCTEYNNNRKKLADLIFRLRSFTEQELTDKFAKIKEGNGDIGGVQTIHDFLDDLRELDVLGFEAGRYFHRQKTRRPQRVAA
jgi:hypothetical protein